MVLTLVPSQSETHWPRICVNAPRRAPSQTGPSGNSRPVASTVCAMGGFYSRRADGDNDFVLPNLGGVAYERGGDRRTPRRPGRAPSMRWLVFLLVLCAVSARAQSSYETVDAYQEDGAYSLIIV